MFSRNEAVQSEMEQSSQILPCIAQGEDAKWTVTDIGVKRGNYLAVRKHLK